MAPRFAPEIRQPSTKKQMFIMTKYVGAAQSATVRNSRPHPTGAAPTKQVRRTRPAQLRRVIAQTNTGRYHFVRPYLKRSQVGDLQILPIAEDR
jgi:hypothetical protein